MTPGEWLVEKGIPLFVQSILVPVGVYIVNSLRQMLKEFRDVGDAVKEHSLELANLKAAQRRTEEDLAHVRGNVEDLGRYLKSRSTFRGFRAELRERKAVDDESDEGEPRESAGQREGDATEGPPEPLRAGREEG